MGIRRNGKEMRNGRNGDKSNKGEMGISPIKT